MPAPSIHTRARGCFPFFVSISLQGVSFTTAGAVTRGKVSRERLEEMFGPNLLASVAAVAKEEGPSASGRHPVRIKNGNNGNSRRNGAGSNGGIGDGGVGDSGPSRGRLDVGDGSEKADQGELPLSALTGSDTAPGKLQVPYGHSRAGALRHRLRLSRRVLLPPVSPYPAPERVARYHAVAGTTNTTNTTNNPACPLKMTNPRFSRRLPSVVSPGGRFGPERVCGLRGDALDRDGHPPRRYCASRLTVRIDQFS